MPRLKVLTLLSLATLFAPAFSQAANPARPGTINYVEGQASLDGQVLSPRSVGSAELESGQTLDTGNGKAEVLLTPGIFLRLDSDTSIKMVSPDLTRTEVQVDHGRAEIEIDQIYKQNNILIDERGAQARLDKGGLYEFDANADLLRVFGVRQKFPKTAALQDRVKRSRSKAVTSSRSMAKRPRRRASMARSTTIA